MSVIVYLSADRKLEILEGILVPWLFKAAEGERGWATEYAPRLILLPRPKYSITLPGSLGSLDRDQFLLEFNPSAHCAHPHVLQIFLFKLAEGFPAASRI